MRAKTVMMHDELIEGVNYFPHYEVVPAGGARTEDCQEDRQKRHRAAVALLNRMARDAQTARINTKIDRAAELMGRIAARRNAPVPSAENAGPSAEDMATQWAEAYAAQADRRCAEAKAAYDARNPHKRKEAAT